MPRLPARTLAIIALALAIAVTPSAAYYHYVHYTTASAPYSIAFEKIDITTLPNKTLTFLVSDSGPANYTTNDSFPSVLSQIRNAAAVWNSVATSDLRVSFGGLETEGTPHNVPTGEIAFDEMPPGLLAFSGPSSRAAMVQGPNGPFVPILESIIHLNVDMTVRPSPSYSELFFTTVVHEMGHAIGLQHTFTSSTMSTAVTRATSRARPLDADDIASVSMLYPKAGFPLGFGTITGQVTEGGQGVHMASVVAILPNGSAIGTLTNPDGSYEIDGVPPGNYYVYAHPLPPTANIRYPIDVNGLLVIPSPAFSTLFYPNTRDPSQFGAVSVAAGAAASGIDFSVEARNSVEIFDVSPYSYPSPVAGQLGPAPIQPAYLNGSASIPVQTVVADGYGITDGPNAAPGLTVQVLAAPGTTPLQAYALEGYGYPNTALAIYLQYPSAPPIGPQHLLFTSPDDIYVLPQALQIVSNQPPMITGLTPNADGSVTVTGVNMGPDSLVYFDGFPGAVTVPFATSGTSSAGTITVMPPPGYSGQVSTLTVFNGDGQNSMFVQSQAPLTYTYPQAAASSANISVSALPQGATAFVDVTSSTMQFVDGLTTLGFGGGDVSVLRTWVLSPNELIADVSVSPNAVQQTTVATVISGFQVYEQSAAFQTLPALSNLPIIGLPVANSIASENSLYPGAIAAVYGLNLVDVTGTPSITVSGQPAQILYAAPTQINFVIPPSLSYGPALMTLNNGTTNAFAVEIQLDPPPPVIAGAPQSAAPGDTVTLIVTGLDPSVLTNPGRVSMTEGSVNIQPFTMQLATDGSGSIWIQFTLLPYLTGQQVPVTVAQDGDLSQPLLINVAAPQPAP